MTPRDGILALKAQMSQNIVGQEHILERLLIGLLANGNLLGEGLPGLAKTRAVKSLIEFRTNRMRRLALMTSTWRVSGQGRQSVR